MITLALAIAAGGGAFAAAYVAGDWGLGWSIFAGVLGFGVFQGVAGYLIQKRVKREIDRWMTRFPKGVTCEIASDTTAFTLVFLKETFRTLVLALVLVVLVTGLVLQDF